MAELRGDIEPICKNDNGALIDDELEEVNEKELEDQVNDIVEIKKKDLLRKNIMNIVRENLMLKQEITKLKAELANTQENNDSYNMLFRIDNDGDDDINPTALTDTQHSLIMTNSQEEIVEEEPKKTGNSCFNCLGDHMIVDCPLPRNPKQISKNKKEFQSKQMPNVPRYHVDDHQKFGHIKPGLLSSKLREALRLRDDQLPEFVYRMRSKGYPPGWLKHAQIKSSGISLYHDRNKKLSDPGNEEGEVRDERDKVEYDISKLVEWPGFNVHISKEYRDETRKYRAIDISRGILLQTMKEELKLKEQQGYVRGKMQDTSCIDLTESGDLIVLDETVDGDSEDGLDDQKMEEEVNLDNTEVSLCDTSSAHPVESSPVLIHSTPSRQTSSSSTSSASSSNKVSKTEPGTPICETFSPFLKLPKQERFGKDMSEHVVFENLPDYTGKWDQMSSLIKKIRSRDAKKTGSS